MTVDHHSPPSHLASPCTTHEQGHTSTLKWFKLRNSCGACASSKLKCSQEKPTCSRCAKRGTLCVYVVAKRGGRKPKHRPSVGSMETRTTSSYSIELDSTHVNAAMDMNMNADVFFSSSLPSANWSAPPSSPGTIQQTPWRNISSPSDVFHDLFGPLYESLDLSSSSMEAAAGLDNSSSMLTFSNEKPDINFFGTAGFFPSTTESNSTRDSETMTDVFAASEDTILPLSSLSRHNSLPNHPPFTNETRDADEESCQTADRTSCSCLMQALESMKLLFSLKTSDACSTWPSQGLEKTAIIQSIQAVITQNKATLEVLSTMLQCSCSQDGYLIVVASLIVFKVLN